MRYMPLPSAIQQKGGDQTTTLSSPTLFTGSDTTWLLALLQSQSDHKRKMFWIDWRHWGGHTAQLQTLMEENRQSCSRKRQAWWEECFPAEREGLGWVHYRQCTIFCGKVIYTYVISNASYLFNHLVISRIEFCKLREWHTSSLEGVFFFSPHRLCLSGFVLWGRTWCTRRDLWLSQGMWLLRN